MNDRTGEGERVDWKVMWARLFYWAIALAMLLVGLGCIVLLGLGVSGGSVLPVVVGALGIVATVQTVKLSVEGLRKLAQRTRRRWVDWR